MIKKQLSTLNAMIESDNIYITDIDKWALFCFDKNNKKINWACNLFFDEEDKLFWNEDIMHIGNSYYFSYRNVIRIKEYNVDTNKVTNYDMGGRLGENWDFKCRICFEYEGDIVMLPGDITGDIWKFSTRDHTFVSLGKINNRVQATFVNRDNRIIIDYSLLNGRYWYINKVNNSVCYIDGKKLERGELNIEPTGKMERILSPRKSDEHDSIFLFDSEGCIYEFDGVDLKHFGIGLPISDISSIFKYNGKTYVIPKMSGEIPIYDDEGNKQNSIILPSEYKRIREIRSYDGGPSRAVIAEGKCYLPPFSANGMIIVDMKSNSVEYICTDVLWREIARITKESRLIQETERIKLDDFLSDILNGHKMDDIKVKNTIMFSR